jgi:hypothetical protein
MIEVSPIYCGSVRSGEGKGKRSETYIIITLGGGDYFVKQWREEQDVLQNKIDEGSHIVKTCGAKK